MLDKNYTNELTKRRTFAIISHPDAGKTTITEKMLLLGKAIHISGVIKGRGNKNYAKSDWMNIEKKRGISVTTSVMQFTYKNILINLLDTPGHQDFSEDTYRILTAVDCCLVVIDAAKGIEERTKKLIEVTRVNNTPIITFINKLDRDSRDPISLLDEIENELKINCIPITWPISCGKDFQGVYHIYEKIIYFYKNKFSKNKSYFLKNFIDFSNVSVLKKILGLDICKHIYKELELIIYIYAKYNHKKFLQAIDTPIFFGSALGEFGIDHILNALINWAPYPIYRKSNKRFIYPQEKKFTGFVFKIQANMDLKHRDRMAFMRIVSGKYKKGIKLKHIRINKYITISDAFSFLAGERISIQEAYPGDIIGLHNHGTIKIGDTFTEGEDIKFIDMPIFAPEIFRQIYLINPLKQKQLKKGLIELSEEGTIQVFRSILNNDCIVGAIGILQFDVVIERLKVEYNIDAIYKKVNIVLARWINCKNHYSINEFKKKYNSYLAYDTNNYLIYLAPSVANLNIVMNQHNDIIFDKVRK
ncbi:peptide chain release factor 3 [Buchnera aphidicola]|uniref:peptide chain release factor 3 n=1 Tax=Buchnera aphidicola TaxID=9 RepID=UPI003CE501B0